MNIEQLVYIVEVAKMKSLVETAKILNVSQSALSQAITRLEGELQLKLFHRDRTGARTTKEGDKIVEKAQLALHAINHIKEEAQNLLRHTDDLLRISMIPGLTHPIMDTYLHFTSESSRLKLEINEQGSRDIIEHIRQGLLDVGFIAVNKTNMGLIDNLHFTPVLEGELMVFAPKGLSLHNEAQDISTEVLKQQLFVLYKDEYVQDFMAHFQRLHGPVNLFFQTTNMQAISHSILKLNAVTIGHDVSVMFDPAHDAQFIQAVPLKLSNVSFRFGWVRLHDYKLSSEAQRFITTVGNRLRQQQKEMPFTSIN